jgi:hypothetical protein
VKKRRRTGLGNARTDERCESALTRLISLNVDAAKARYDQRARFQIHETLVRAKAAFSDRCLRK